MAEKALGRAPVKLLLLTLVPVQWAQLPYLSLITTENSSSTVCFYGLF